MTEPSPTPAPDRDALPPGWPRLDGLGPLLRGLALRGALRRYRRGQVLIEEGDSGDTLYIIVNGRLRAYAVGDNGREITYGIYGPGEYLGEMSLDGGPRAASVAALESTQCIMVTRATLVRYLADQPEFAMELLTKVIRRARSATLSARQLALNDVYGRLRMLLVSLAAPQADGTGLIAERLTHRDIAQRLGCTREMVGRLLKDLATGGFVSPESGGLRLLKPLPQRW